METELNAEIVEIEKAQAIDVTVAGITVSGATKQGDALTQDTPDEAIEPPVSLDALAKLSQVSSTRRSIIDAVARNTVGLGYTVTPADDDARPDTEREDKGSEVISILEALAARDTRLDSPSFTELLMAIKTDEEEVGNGYLEVSRNKITGKIDGLFHAPAKRVRRKKDRTGFLMLGPSGSSDDAVEFYTFGSKVEYADGAPTNDLQRDKDWGVNELLPFRIYTSESRDYGLPRDVGMVLEYAGDKLAAESNISFFDSSGTPPTVIFIQGEESNTGQRITFKVPQATVERIASTLKSDGGHRHRVGIVPLPPGSKVESVQLGQFSERDMGFVDYRKDNKFRQLAAFRLSPIFIADSDDGGRYTAEVQRAISLEQVFDPEQRRYEVRLRNTILRDLGYGDHTIAFKRLAVEANAALRDSADKMAEAGTITRREHRKAHGFSAIPEAAKSDEQIEWPAGSGHNYKSAEPGPGQVPYGWNDEVISTGQPAGAQNRVAEGTSQQGLRPGIGGRARRQQTRYGSDANAEAGAQSAAVTAKAIGDTATSNGRTAALTG